jgi:uncharacterized cupin superfamily protein
MISRKILCPARRARKLTGWKPARIRNNIHFRFGFSFANRKDTSMSKITVEHNPDTSRLSTLGVSSWPTWSKEVSTFPWTYSEQEVAYVLEGEVVVTPQGGEPVKFGKGDLVTFPAGMSCTWDVRQPLRKHYQFG